MSAPDDVDALLDALAFLNAQLTKLVWDPIPVWNRLWRAKWHLEQQLEDALRRAGI